MLIIWKSFGIGKQNLYPTKAYIIRDSPRNISQIGLKIKAQHQNVSSLFFGALLEMILAPLKKSYDSWTTDGIQVKLLLVPLRGKEKPDKKN